jgi:hypothetical protein
MFSTMPLGHFLFQSKDLKFKSIDAKYLLGSRIVMTYDNNDSNEEETGTMLPASSFAGGGGGAGATSIINKHREGASKETARQSFASKRPLATPSLILKAAVFVSFIYANGRFLAYEPSAMVYTTNKNYAAVRFVKVIGHLHYAKTAGTEINGELAAHYERVCGHKG